MWLVVGLGGLGSPAALYLAAAGVGRLLLADGDAVELSNLQRQIAHGEADIGLNKARSAAASIARLNPGTRVQVIPQRLDEASLAGHLAGVDLVLDASDNYPVRFALNRACIDAGLPLVSGAAVRSEGQVALFDPHRGGGCYRCLYPRQGAEGALGCSDSGVLAPVVGIVGSLQAMEALKVLSRFRRAPAWAPVDAGPGRHGVCGAWISRPGTTAPTAVTCGRVDPRISPRPVTPRAAGGAG